MYHVFRQVILRRACCILYIIVCLYIYIFYRMHDATCLSLIQMYQMSFLIFLYFAGAFGIQHSRNLHLPWWPGTATYDRCWELFNNELIWLFGASEVSNVAEPCWAFMTKWMRITAWCTIQRWNFFLDVFLWVLVESCWCFLLSQVWKAFSPNKIGLIAEFWTLSSPNFKMSVGFIQVLKPLITPETARDLEIWI